MADVGLEKGLGASPFDWPVCVYICVYMYTRIYVYNHCGSRAILGFRVNGEKKLFFVCCLSLDEKC